MLCCHRNKRKQRQDIESEIKYSNTHALNGRVLPIGDERREEEGHRKHPDDVCDHREKDGQGDVTLRLPRQHCTCTLIKQQMLKLPVCSLSIGFMCYLLQTPQAEERGASISNIYCWCCSREGPSKQMLHISTIAQKRLLPLLT